MTAAPFWTTETFRAYAVAHGLADLERDEAERMAMLATRALETGFQIPRQSKNPRHRLPEEISLPLHRATTRSSGAA